MSANKVILTKEQESFIRDNYKTMNGFQLSVGTRLTHRIIKRRMSELGLVRTDEEKNAVWAKRRMPDVKEIANRNRKIECGGRGNYKTKYHLDKWNAENGSFSSKHMLVYKNGKFDDYNDLKLIRKWRYDIFVNDRDSHLENAKNRLIKREEKALIDEANRKKRAIEKEKKDVIKDAINKEKKQKREIVLAALALKKEEKEKIEKVKRAETAKRMAISAKKANITKKNKEANEERQKQLDEIKANSKPLKETHATMLKEEKVRVRIDHRTTIYVKKSLCVQLENGDWVKNTNIQK